MRISTDVWHARLYFWCARLLKTFQSSNEYIEILPRSNICVYTRVLMGGFGALLCYGGALFYFGATYIYDPSIFFGWTYWKLILSFLLLIVATAIFFLLIFGAGEIFSRLKLWWGKRRKEVMKIEKHIEGTADRPSVVAVAREYVRAQAEGICTGIEFVAP